MHASRLPADLDPLVVYDVGGDNGMFAASCAERWPDATIVSFEPLPDSASRNWARARGRWRVEEVALGERAGDGVLHVSRAQASASTLLEPGTARAGLGIDDRWYELAVPIRALDEFRVGDPALLKIDVEGFELEVLRGATSTLVDVAAVVIEVQNDPEIFRGSPTLSQLNEHLAGHGLHLDSLVGAYLDPRTQRVLQFDGLWLRR